MIGHPYNSFSGHPPLLLVLDDYEAVNLLWLLEQTRKAVEERDPILATGDWSGQLEFQLTEALTAYVAERNRFKGAEGYTYALPKSNHP